MIEDFSLFIRLFQIIHQSQSFLIIAHQNPDGDSLGSALALRRYIQSLGKQAICFCVDKPHSSYVFFPEFRSVACDISILKDYRFDTIIIMDSDIRYTGIQKELEQLAPAPIFVSIDHHFTNNKSSDLNIVFSKTSSTAAILYHFFLYHKIFLDKIYALYLLSGIVYDTDCFLNPGTDAMSFDISSRLMLHGARMNIIIRSLLKNKPLSVLKLWGRALSRLKHNAETGMATTFISIKDFQELQVDESSTNGISNFLNSFGEARAVLILKEFNGGYIKGSLRTTNDCIDVSKYAKIYGGGGHKKAAGFIVKGTVRELEQGWKIVPEEPSSLPKFLHDNTFNQ